MATTTVSGLVKGIYQYELTVTDNAGASAKDVVQITVNGSQAIAIINKAPVANAGADKAITLPLNTITLTGNGTDADGKISSYSWVKITGIAGNINAGNTATATVSGLVAGIYQYELTVKDNAGATGKIP